ncbi:MAG: hypothetical protein J0I77_09475 [Rudaea sp.]|uniref:hypothetical protein n=1 Tax=unclassified Rudaea TaxID=2627037 RepID=UPI0010F5D148|nr:MULTISPECIES: hypothetical protein [unclassified Rudaea]MBN8885937.1 hypothetical protein [Rudaea sp.]MBR0347010.1 hypothetical protein [Rudaea sp.]
MRTQSKARKLAGQNGAAPKAAQASRPKQVRCTCTLTIEDVNIAKGELRINLSFNPALQPNYLTTPAINAALHALESLKAKSAVLEERQG